MSGRQPLIKSGTSVSNNYILILRLVTKIPFCAVDSFSRFFNFTTKFRHCRHIRVHYIVVCKRVHDNDTCTRLHARLANSFRQQPYSPLV